MTCLRLCADGIERCSEQLWFCRQLLFGSVPALDGCGFRGLAGRKKKQAACNQSPDRIRTFRTIVFMRRPVLVHCVDDENCAACPRMVLEFS